MGVVDHDAFNFGAPRIFPCPCRPTPTVCRSTSSDLPDGVLSAVRIGHAQHAFRIVPPLAVHDEPVVVGAGRQGHSGFPNPFGALRHGNGLRLPLCEVACQQYAQRVGGGECEGLSPVIAAVF